MFAFVKKLLGKKTETSPAVSKAAAPAGAPAEKAAPPAAGPAPVQGGTSRLTRAEVSARTAAVPPPTLAGDPNATVNVSLLGVVDLLPKELKPTKAVGDIASVQIAVPVSLVAGQLSSGCVRISFGELKQLAPQGFFTVSGSDDKLIALPLQEILPQVTATLFTRRDGQQAVYVPEDVTNVFSARGGTVAPTNKASAFSASVPASQPQATPPAAPKSPAAPANPVAQGGSPGRPNPASGSTTMYFKRPGAGAAPGAKTAEAAKAAGPAVGNSAPAQPSRPATTPSAPVKPTVAAAPATPVPAAEPTPPVSKPIAAPNLLAALKPGAPAAPAPAKPKASAPIPGPAPIQVSARSAPVAPSKATATPAPAPSATAPTNEAGDERVVSIPLSKVSATWPEAVQAEMSAWQIGAASVVIPVSQVEAALRQGRVSYPWSTVLALLEQGAGEGRQSSAGETVLEFPLSVVAPAFLAARQSAPVKAASAIDATIPDLFQAAKPSEPAAAAPVGPAAPAAPAAPAKAAAKPAAPAAAKPASGLSMKAAPAAPVAAPAAPVVDPHAGEFLSIPVAMVDDSWLEPIKADLAKTKNPGLKLQIPYEEVNRGLKAGKLEYPWKQIRAWIQPAVPATLAADHSEKPVTLPLKVVAPLFLGHFKPGKGGKKTDIAQDIPDLFSGGSSAPAEIATTAPSPAPTPAAPVADSTSKAEPAAASGSGSYSTTQFFRKPPTDIGELFGQPGKRHWSPQEIVQGTARIKGVAGAVIAMQDGLLVAAHLQSPWRPEATAAFLPQIYSRLNQYLHELSVGDLRSVTLDTPSGKLLVFTTGIIYFAVVTKPDESVPIAAIELIVGELGRHSK